MRNIKGLLVAALASYGLLLVMDAGAVEYRAIVPDKSQVTFTSRQMGVPVEGRFQRFNADVRFDPAKPENAQAKIDIDLASIDAGSREANDEVVGKGWFNVREFPRATFVSERITTVANNRYEARGKLTIKGRTRDAAIAFSYRADGTLGVIEGTLPLLRTQFGIGDGMWGDTTVVADEVPVKFRLFVRP